jgi:hypothetical protein
MIPLDSNLSDKLRASDMANNALMIYFDLLLELSFEFLDELPSKLPNLMSCVILMWRNLK